MSEHRAEADTVGRRLERLERQNRRLRWGVAAVGLAAVAALLFGARPAITQPATVSYATVQARHFVLVDAAGKTRAVLDLLPGGPRLALLDAAGNVRASLALLPDGSPRLALADAAGNERFSLDVLPGMPRLALRNAAGKIGALLAVLPDGSPRLALADAAGNERFRLDLLFGGPYLTLLDATGKRRAALSLAPDGRPALELYDATGKERLAVGSTALKYPKRGGSALTPTSSISAFDKKGKEVGFWP